MIMISKVHCLRKKFICLILNFISECVIFTEMIKFVFLVPIREYEANFKTGCMKNWKQLLMVDNIKYNQGG